MEKMVDDNIFLTLYKKISGAKLTLKKEPIIKNAKYISIPNITRDDLIANLCDSTIKQEYNDCVRYFINVLSLKAPHYNLDCFNKNLKTLKIRKNGFKRFFDGASAFYDIGINSIVFNSRDFLNSIFHELFHASSSYMFEHYNLFGFFQFDNKRKVGIGTGLDEGYTDLLSSRYFGEYFEKCYTMEMYFARFIESVVGQKKMENFYSRGDLGSLISELEQYNSRKKIIAFLKDLDYIIKNKKKLRCKKSCKNIILKICSFIAECYSNKLHLLVSNGLMTSKQCEKNIRQFLYQLYRGIDFLEEKEFNFVKTEDIKTERDNNYRLIRVA